MRTGGSLLLLLSLLMSCAPEKTSPPNILFIFTDDHAYQAISAYGGRLEKIAPTPRIDRLAKEGMRFDRCYVANSICAPSRATVLTGKHSHLNGVRDNQARFDSSQQTFVKLLQASGYQTALVGKWHLRSAPTGFDHWEVLPGQGSYYNPDFLSARGKEKVEGYVTDIITRKAIDWLDKRDKERPFVMMVQHKAPHREWMPGPDHLGYLFDTPIPEPDNLFDTYENRGSAARDQDMTLRETMRPDIDLKLYRDTTLPAWRWTYGRMNKAQRKPWDSVYNPVIDSFYKSSLRGDQLLRFKYQRYMQDYLATVRSVDDNIGRLLDYLEKSGLSSNTIVVYSSDQGFYLGEHGWFDKRFMYEESFRTPLIVRWPGVVNAGSVNKHLVSNLDFAQTFLDMAGLEAPADMQGLSLVPLLKGSVPSDWRSSLYYHYYEYPVDHRVQPHEGVTDGKHKLIHFYQTNEWEYYDLEKDPQEMHNGYDAEENQEIVASLRSELAQLKILYRLPDR